MSRIAELVVASGAAYGAFLLGRMGLVGARRKLADGLLSAVVVWSAATLPIPLLLCLVLVGIWPGTAPAVVSVQAIYLTFALSAVWLGALAARALQRKIDGRSRQTLGRDIARWVRAEVRRADLSDVEPDVVARPQDGIWYSPQWGRRILLTFLALIFTGSLVLLMAHQDLNADDQLPRALTLSLSGPFLSVVFPLATAWALLALVTGAPRLRHSLSRITRCTGNGIALGVIIGVGAFYVRGQLASTEPNGLLSYSLVDFVAYSTVGMFCGLIAGFAICTAEAAIFVEACGRSNRYLAAFMATIASAGSALVSVAVVPPSRVAGWLVDGLIAGEPMRAPDDRSWEILLAESRNQMIERSAAPATVVILVSLIAFVASVGPLARWWCTRGDDDLALSGPTQADEEARPVAIF